MTSRLLKHSISDKRALWLQDIGSDLPYTEGSLSLCLSFYVSLSPSLECSDGGGVGGKLEMFLSSSQTKVQYTVLSSYIHAHMPIKSQLWSVHTLCCCVQSTYIHTWTCLDHPQSPTFPYSCLLVSCSSHYTLATQYIQLFFLVLISSLTFLPWRTHKPPINMY